MKPLPVWLSWLGPAILLLTIGVLTSGPAAQGLGDVARKEGARAPAHGAAVFHPSGCSRATRSPHGDTTMGQQR